MLFPFIATLYLMPTTFCQLFSCEHYLRRRVAGVFHYDRGRRYSLSYMEARLTCERDFGASIADKKQLLAANRVGMEECRAGWILEAEAAYPRVHLNWNCGQNQTGIISYGVRKNLLEKWDVFCYKVDNNCAVFQRAKSPGLPERNEKDGLLWNFGDKFHKASSTEHLNITQLFQGRQGVGPSESPLVMKSMKDEGYMTYTSGPGIESSSSLNGLTGGNKGPSNINNHQDLKSDPNTDTKMLSIPLSEVIEAFYETSDGKNSSVGSTISAVHGTEPPLTIYFTHASSNTPTSEILDSPVVSTPSSDGSSLKVNSDIQSNTVTPSQPSVYSDTFSVPNTQTSTEVLNLMHATALRLDKDIESTSSKASASVYLNSIFSGQTADALQLEPQESDGVENFNKYTGHRQSDSTENKMTGIHAFQPLSYLTPINSVESITVGKSDLSPATTASMDQSSSPSLAMVPIDQNAHSPSASPENKFGEPVAIISHPEEHGNGNLLMAMDELNIDLQSDFRLNVSTSHVEVEPPLDNTSAAPSFSNESNGKYARSDHSKALDGLDHNPENFPIKLAATLNQSCAGGNVSWNASCITVKQWFNELIQSRGMSPYSTSTSMSDTTEAHLLLDKKQEPAFILQQATFLNEYFVSSTVNTARDHGTHIPVPTSSAMTEAYSKSTMIPTETAEAGQLFEHFTVEHNRHIPQATTSQILHSDSLLTTNVETASTMATPQLNFTTGIPEMFEATTRMSCGGMLGEGHGDIQSPGFPRAYPSELDCTWVIIVQQGHVVQLTFQSMNLEEHRGCEYDYIIVFDGRTSKKQEIGRFCGRELPPTLRSSSNIMTVAMKSDSSVELGGFSAHYQTSKSPASSGIVIRLIGGKNWFEGHVEIDITGVKVGVCAENWGKREATLVCRKLGFMGNAVAGRMPAGVDDLPVTVFVVKCHGDERSLDQCEMHRESACSTADRAAVHCQVAESCAVLRDSGVLESGVYIIDPDGPAQEQKPFPVYCDMDSEPGAGLTVVRHNSESRIRVDPCEQAGCYSREVVYQNASLHQLRALIEASLSCTQKVKVECRHIRFLGAQWGWWTSWEGRRVYSWGGAPTGSGRCACGERGDCDLGLSTCNCDANDEVWRSDDGFLSDMGSLPVREVRFGDTRDVPMEMAFHTIGPLQCRGHSSAVPVLVSCAALKEAGITLSGWYLIDPDGIGYGVSQFEVYCDMDSDTITGVTVVSHDAEGRVRVTPCEEPGCYSRALRYEADLAQLQALAQASSSCQQHVKFDCRHTRFVQSGWGWWVSRTGQRRLDWGGAQNSSGSCACGITGTCDKPGLLCNCDSNDHIWRSDQGVLADKSALPVRSVHFGDTKDIPLEMAYHTIGKFTCSGKG